MTPPVVDAPSRHDVRRAVDEVMSRPEFAEPEKGWFETWREEVWAGIRDALGELFSALFDVLPEEGLARTLVIGWMIVTLLAIVAHFVWTLVQLRRAGPAAGTDGAVDDDLHAHVATSAEALDLARRAASDGRFDVAMSALYRATVLWLDEHGEVALGDAKTGGDYARDLADAERRRTFRALLRDYYPVAFGGRVPDAEAFAAMSAHAARLGVPTS